MATPPGWAEELQDALNGMAMAQPILEKRQRKRPPASERPGRPVYGTAGQHYVPGRGVV